MNYRDALGATVLSQVLLALAAAVPAIALMVPGQRPRFGGTGRAILFSASLVSAAAREDEPHIFQNNYHFPVMTPLYDSLYVQLTAIMDASDYICGDADGNERIDITDVVFLVNYIFAGGPAPDPPESGDADCLGEVSTLLMPCI